MTLPILSRKILASFTIFSLLTMMHPIGVANAAAVITEVTPVPTLGNSTTPSYTFSSDAAGTVTYGGSCSANSYLSAVIGNNTITFDTIFDGTYNDCTVTVDDGAGLSNVLTVSSFTIDATPPTITVQGSPSYTLPRGAGYVDSGAVWSDNRDGGGTEFPVGASGTVNPVNTSQTGTYIITYTHTDTAGNTATGTRTVIINQGGSPTITMSGSNPIMVPLGGSFVDPGATATDPEDGTIPVTTSGTVDPNTLGTYLITYDATDSSSNVAPTITRTVNVVAGSMPTITLRGVTPKLAELGVPYTDSGANAMDLEDGDLSFAITTTGTVNWNVAGTYTIDYNVVDSGLNPAPTVTRTVIVADRTAPVITLNGSANITLNRGSPYTELGANWTDLIDGSGAAILSGSVNTAVLGTYVLTYSKTDTAGNTGATVTRTVDVVTGSVPVITLSGSSTMTLLRGQAYVEPGATATDFEDGTLPVTITGSVDTNTVGTYVVTYSVTDSNSNVATLTRTVDVVIGSAPVITLSGSAVVDLIFGDTYIESGATATDLEDGALPVSISGTVNTNAYGTYIVTYSATDSNSNTITTTRTVNVRDNVPPVIALLGSGNITINAGSVYIDAGATWTDNIDGSGTIAPNGVVNTSLAGLYILSYNYTDSSGNTGSFVTRQVNVVALASIPFTSGPGGGGGSSTYGGSSYGVVLNSAPSYATNTSDLLIPSIARLLKLSLGQDTNSASTPSSSSSSEVTYDVVDPVTPVICPVVKEYYTLEDNGLDSVNEGEFTEDVQAMIMFRGVDGSNDVSNYSQRYLLNQSSGIVKNNEFYEGSRSITRAEFVKMLVRALSCHYTASSTGSQFSDVSEYAWYAEYINYAAEEGWISGFEDGTFHPHDLITRGEAAKILAKAIELETGDIISDTSFTDVPKSNSFAPYIYALKDNNIIGGKTTSFYDTNSNISRNEVARIFHKTFLSVE